MRGPKSRAGLMAYPVVPPSESPMPHTSAPTRYGPRPPAGPVAATCFEKIVATTNTSVSVPITSLMKFHAGLRIAGTVQKIASLAGAEEHTSELQSHHDLVC